MRDLLETDCSLSSQLIPDSTLPIVPNYLRNPVFLYSSENPSNLTTNENEQNLVTLLCRIADDPKETDFIEFDFDKRPVQGSYQRLSHRLCEEFQINDFEKIRRLPHIRIRNDRDVERLKDNHMLEVVVRSTMNPLSSTDTLQHL